MLAPVARLPEDDFGERLRTVNATRREALTAGDVNAAISLVRRVDLGLRAPDAINIAIAQRCDATLLTFDEKMARSAQSLGMNVIN